MVDYNKIEKMNTPLVSVIIPIYNMQDYLAETITSVLNSSYPNMEIILMDDSSKDNSFQIAQEFAQKYSFISSYQQVNGGACAARNHAIDLSKGKYILPVDADDLVGPDYIKLGVEILENNENVKVVTSEACFFGAKTGDWTLPPFSLHLLARKNMINVSSLYRKSDWQRVGGYNEAIPTREDWAFWISVLKEGGDVVRLPYKGLYYRIRSNSKRNKNRYLKNSVIDSLNRLHPEFFQRELNGPLRHQRTYSYLINTIFHIFSPSKLVLSPGYENLRYSILSLPRSFDTHGNLIYKGRNEIRQFKIEGKEIMIKSYKIPHFINRVIYGWFRSSKAERAYEYALKLLSLGIGTPTPIGYLTVRRGFLFSQSYFICLKSVCDHHYYDLIKENFSRRDEILKAIAQTTAKLHENGIYPKDYSQGNILFKEEKENIVIDIIDLNRMSFGKVNLEKGCKNFERLPGNREMFKVLSKEYARMRNFDEKKCIDKILDFAKM